MDQSTIHVVFVAENDILSVGAGERNRLLAPLHVVAWAYDCKVARATSDVIVGCGEVTTWQGADIVVQTVMDKHVNMN